ncbi:MAG TPA: MFS transporter [Myxococcaceae bacterium]|nr:MFS transporter [Myxococcaceae bacterium]
MRENAAKTSLFANRDFRLLFTGSSISVLGDQFTLLALPWLVLKLTGDPRQLGFVLALMALPLAVFLLIGGAVVDRMSPRKVLLSSRAVNAVLIAILAMLVLAGAIQMWEVYVLALAIGLSTAFAYPASTAILPQLLEPEQLAKANATLMGVRQFAMLAGPAIAGFVIGLGSAGSAQNLADARGMGLAFSIDAVSFLFSVASLMMVRVHSDYHPPKKEGGVLGDVAKGIRFVWSDLQLRAFILYMGAVSVFVAGPLLVGLPVLANTRMDLGARSLGLLRSANGAGILAGSAISSFAMRRIGGRVGLLVLCVDTVVGLGIAALTLVHSTLVGSAVMAAVGALAGMVQIALFTWVQRRVPQAYMGRTMSLLIFTFMGLSPVVASAAGVLLRYVGLGPLFVGAGFTLSAVALLCLTRPTLRGITTRVAPAKA